MFEIGRICMKVAGREAGKYCVVVAKEKDKEFLLITGPKAATHVRRRKCNCHHLEATPYKVEIAENASDEEIMKAYEKDDIFARLKIVPFTEEQLRLSAERAAKHKEAKPAHAHHEQKTDHKHEAHNAEHTKAKEHKEAHHEHKPEHAEAKAKKPRASKKKKE
jgi:large subunit ribosomal protein L14e